ncbi:hypothetical protein SAY87_020502 [Trapa incisa]|uniref:Uncharacterized protein n=2 Tax=Trapa TaxID=22665 RepID=A0AAN7MI99_TRANT|nr:hypothetical protein SAY87_020502 [Trapa incisa]KAK4804431.1 hypothetical protein SAY86_004248 [Trapa natans]
MDPERRHSCIIPLISRLDHLDFIVKRLESKRETSKWTSRSSEIMPLDLGTRDVCFKGSLMDRVTSLERRLLQLSLEMDSSNSSLKTSMLTPSDDTSSGQECKREPASSSKTFNFPVVRLVPEPPATHHNNKPEIQQLQATSSQLTEQIAKSKKKPTAAPAKVHTRKNRTAGEANKSCKTLSKKQQKPRTPLYIRLLGC